MLHKHEDDTYTISSRQVWIPGCYEDERTAKYAFRFPNAELQKLQDAINKREPEYSKRFITFGDLQRLAERVRARRTEGATVVTP